MNQEREIVSRKVYFDYLRVAAIFAVIVIHVCAQNWYSVDTDGFEWQVFNCIDSMVRWGVPVFVMISGALFLGRSISVKKIYSKYILRLIVAFIVWSAIYSFFVEGSIVNKLDAFILGHYHMWFILMIIGLYASVPLIKPIVEDGYRIQYFLVFSFLFAFVIPEIINILNDLGNGLLAMGANYISIIVGNMHMHMVMGYAFYFVLGYYISRVDIEERHRIVIYILGALGIAMTMILETLSVIKTQTYCDNYYDDLSVNVFFEAVAVFVWFKHRKFERSNINKFVQKLSEWSFGVYLVHALVIERLDEQFGLNTLSFNPVFAIIFISTLVLGISYLISFLINQIPYVKKYIV